MESFSSDLYWKAKDYLTLHSSDEKNPLGFYKKNAGDEFPVWKLLI